VDIMQLTSADQGLLLAGTLGFMTFVAILHLSESAVLAAKLRAWVPLWWSGLLLLAAIILLVWRIGADLSQGVRFSDVLVVFGGQLGLLVCLPSRWLSRRKCQWDRKRAQLELQAQWWRQASQAPNPQHSQQRSQIVFPGPFDHLGQRNHLGSLHTGVGPRAR
jgi:hypothetical protein